MSPPLRAGTRTYLYMGQGLLDVGNQVSGVLDAAGEADQIGGNAGGHQLLVVHLPVGGGGGVEGAGAGVGHVGLDGGQLEVLHKGLSGGPTALEAKGHHAAGPVGHILLSQVVVLVPLQAGEGDKTDLWVGLQVAGHRQGVLTVAGHPHVETLQPQVQQKGVLGGLDRAEIPHELGGTFGDESPSQTEFLGVGDAVVAVVGGAQAGEFFLVGHPVKPATVHDTAAHTGPVAVHILGGGVGDNVAAPLEGPAVYRGGKGVVHNQGDAVGVGGLGELLNVQHREGGVGDGLAKDRLGVGLKGGVQLLLGAVGGDKGEINAHLPHGDVK